MGYSLSQIRAYLGAAERLHRGRLREVALIQRAALNADTKGFERLIEDLDG